MSHAPASRARPVPHHPLGVRLRRRAGALVVDGFFRGLSSFGAALPLARPRRHGVEVLRDIAYRPTGMQEHLLDIYRPIQRSGPLPVVFYVHGGGFRILSKDSHWLFGIAYARRGYLLVNINYRLSPGHRCPAAHEDAASALAWTLDHIAEYGGDPSRIAFAGESAGANIATSLAIAASVERPEAWARPLFDRDLRPRAVLPACGMLQVSEPERFAGNKRIPSVVLDRIVEVSDSYLGGVPAEGFALADPLLILEDPASRWTRPLPPFFAACGTFDPLLDDTRRLEAALLRAGVPCDARYYPRQTHAFHAFYPLPESRRCWRDTFEFLARHLPPGPVPAAAG